MQFLSNWGGGGFGDWFISKRIVVLMAELGEPDSRGILGQICKKGILGGKERKDANHTWIKISAREMLSWINDNSKDEY